MIHSSANKQAIQSKTMITAGLLKLLETEPYHEITVTQICQEAKIVRQTFYRNFDYRKDVLDYYFETEFMKLMSEMPDTGDGRENMRRMFAVFPIPRHILMLLKRQQIFYILEENMRRIISEESRKSYIFCDLLGNPVYQAYQNNVIAAAISTVLSTWVDREFCESPEELARILAELIA